MRKTLALSLFAIYALSANEEISLDSVVVTDTLKSKIVNDISNENLKSADLAQALSEVSPSISLVRRSGIANDIIVRGQKKIILIFYLMMQKFMVPVLIGWTLLPLMFYQIIYKVLR